MTIKEAAGDGVIYLASPYSHPEEAVRVERFHAAALAAGKLMQDGMLVFSPIAHTHPIAVACDLPRGWDYWHKYDRWFIKRCSCVVVLQIPGWNISTGVRGKIEMAAELGKPVLYLFPAP